MRDRKCRIWLFIGTIVLFGAVMDVDKTFGASPGTHYQCVGYVVELDAILDVVSENFGNANRGSCIDQIAFLAKRGISDAQMVLSIAYKQGVSVPQNMSVSKHWLVRAAISGHVEARLALAWMLIGKRDESVESDLVVDWISSLAGNKHPTAQWLLALMYGSGLYVGKDENVAFALLLELVDKHADLVIAYDLVAKGYWHGTGTTSDRDKAISWFKKSAERGFGPSAYNLGLIFSTPHAGNTENKEATKWFEKAFDAGISRAANELTRIYMSDVFLKNEKLAFEWSEKGARADNTISRSNLASFYYDGYGVGQNESRAKYWAEQAAACGDSLSQFLLGAILLSEGLSSSPEKLLEALKWLFVARRDTDQVANVDRILAAVSSSEIAPEFEVGKSMEAEWIISKGCRIAIGAPNYYVQNIATFEGHPSVYSYLFGS